MITVKVAVALIAFGVASAPANVGVDEAVVDYLGPLLKDAGGAARVDYAGICRGQDTLLLPDVAAQPPQQGITGIAAVRNIFRDDPHVTVTQDQSGLLRITIGTVSPTVLQTRIPSLTLDRAAQYTPWVAVYEIAISANNYAKANKLGFGIAATVLDVIVPGRSDSAPHLPKLMQNVTVGEALDSLARTFNGIVLYGTCKMPSGKELFRANYIGGS